MLDFNVQGQEGKRNQERLNMLQRGVKGQESGVNGDGFWSRRGESKRLCCPSAKRGGRDASSGERTRRPPLLLSFGSRGYFEAHSTIVVGLHRGLQIEISQWNFLLA